MFTNLWVLIRKILNELVDVIAKSLLMIFEQSWRPRNVPTDWKLVTIPLISKKHKKDPRNYRPISLTSVPGKVIQKIILRGVEKHLEDNTVISKSQHSFMTRRYCFPFMTK